MEDQGRHQRTSGAELRKKMKRWLFRFSSARQIFYGSGMIFSDPDPDPTFQDVSDPDSL
jgi:hypothetical protein